MEENQDGMEDQEDVLPKQTRETRGNREGIE